MSPTFTFNSIKARLIGLTVAFALLLGIGGNHTQQALSKQAQRNQHVLTTQDALRRRVDALEDSLQRLEFHTYQAALTLDEVHYAGVRAHIEEIEENSRALIAEATKAEPELYGEAIGSLLPLLPDLRNEFEELLGMMGDAQRRYPAMPYMIEKLSPDTDAFLGAAAAALSEGRQMLADGEEMARIIDLIQELRFARVQQTQLFRMFVANRSGAFGQPQEAMRRAEEGIKIYAERTVELLRRLEEENRAGHLGLEQGAALALMAQAQERYTHTMETVMNIYRSDRWRSDLTMLREDIRPLLDRVWSVVADFKRELGTQSENGLLEAEETARTLSLLMGLFSAFITLFLLASFITFEYGLRRPLVQVSSAMRDAAHGHQVEELPAPRNDEARQLVETFQFMQEQVRSRQARLEESERRFRTLVDNAVDTLLVFDRSGNIVDANRHAENYLGYRRDELLALNLTQVTETCSIGDAQAMWEEVAAHGTSTCDGTCRRKDGSTYPAEARVGPVEWEGRSLMLALIRDVGERRQLERQLLQSEKLASIGQLAAGVAHEINNPVGYVYSNLNNLQSYTASLFELLERYERLEPLIAEGSEELGEVRRLKVSSDLNYLREDVPQLITESLEGAQRVRNIVQDLRDFSRSDSGEWEVADLHRCLESTLNIANNEIKYKAEVVREYGELPPIRCLPSQLGQVFLNLLVNAAHAIDKQGTITLRSGTEGQRVWVEVEDTGVGIEREHLGRVFDPFFTTKPVGKGTGLGLSLSYGIVERHGGEITVTSEVGRGSIFRVWLPMEGGGEEAAANTAPDTGA